MAVIFAASLAVEGRIQFGLNILFAEIAVILLLGATVMAGRNVNPPRPVYMLIGAWFFIALAALMVSDETARTFAAVRNMTVVFLAMLSLALCKFTPGQIIKLGRVLALASIPVAMLGIYQAIVGYYSAPTIYSLGLAEETEGVRQALSWKLNNLQEGNLTQQSALSLGLHAYSNNFGEFLVYATIGGLAARRAKMLSLPLLAVILALTFAALYFAAARTGMIGVGLVIAHHMIVSFKSQTSRAVAVILVIIVAGFWLVAIFESSLFGYDNFRTIQGRETLNAASVEAIVANGLSLLFGGNVWAYYTANIQSPHNVLLYVALLFGIPAACGWALFLYWALRRSYKIATRSHDLRQRVVGEAAFIATVWLIVYGFTWSVLEGALSGMMWALFFGASLSMTKIKVRRKIARRAGIPSRYSSPELSFPPRSRAEPSA